MSITEFATLLETLGVPVACNRFTTTQVTPFLVYTDVSSENFAADNITYFEATNVDVDLYTDRINDELENRLKQLFTDNKIFYEWSRNWIVQEKIYQTTFEVIL